MKRLTNLFRTADGKNYALIFLLVCSLFLLWGTCSGMLDVLNKHFQNSLKVTKAQSALVQFAFYMGYFLMAIPSGLLARRFGYKGGILIGLGLIATGAFLFIPATMINTFGAFLAGLFILATGLTCLETIANPYTTVLGPPEMGPTRINLAQSCNGIGWMIGPMLGGYFVLSATAEVNTSNEALYKPYLFVAVVVSILFILFARANVPDLHAEEESKAQKNSGTLPSGKPLIKRWHFTLAVAAQFLYVAAQTGIFSFFINYAVTDIPVISQKAAERLNSLPSRIRVSSYPAAMLAHTDVVGEIKKSPELMKNVDDFATLLQKDTDPRTQPISQFLWAQFSKENQKLLSEPNSSDPDKAKEKQGALVSELNRILEQNPTLRIDDIQNMPALLARFKNPADPVSSKLVEQFSKGTKKLLADWEPAQPPTNTLALAIVAELNRVIQNSVPDSLFANPGTEVKVSPQEAPKANRAGLENAYPEIAKSQKLYDEKRFAGLTLSPQSRNLLAQKAEPEAQVRLNRRLLEEAYPEKFIVRSQALLSPLFRISERGASVLLSMGGFALFLIGRFSGSMVLGICRAHITLALYALINTFMMVLVILPLGWVSVAGLFLSFFFMSIMFPTIFALGIRGLGEHTKIGSSLIVMAIVGGAIMPMFMGWLADIASMRVGFLMPLICFALIFVYGAAWKWLDAKDIEEKETKEIAVA